MNLKYYLRGLGLGIVVTAIIMGLTANSKSVALSDEDIVIKAKNLGMIEEAELTEYVANAKTEMEQKLRDEITAEVEKEAQEKNRLTEEQQVQQVEGSDASQADNEDSEDDVESGKETEAMGMQAEPKAFTVRKGETPYSISERLESEGFVPTAKDFDKFLVDNGYDRKIVAAEYMIPPDADMDIIARIITGHKIAE